MNKLKIPKKVFAYDDSSDSEKEIASRAKIYEKTFLEKIFVEYIDENIELSVILEEFSDWNSTFTSLYLK